MSAMQQRRAVRGGAVGSVVMAQRIDRGWSRKELAYAAGCSREWVQQVELGIRALRVSVAVVWANALGCDPAPLVRALLQDQVTAAGAPLVVTVETETTDADQPA